MMPADGDCDIYAMPMPPIDVAESMTASPRASSISQCSSAASTPRHASKSSITGTNKHVAITDKTSAAGAALPRRTSAPHGTCFQQSGSTPRKPFSRDSSTASCCSSQSVMAASRPPSHMSSQVSSTARTCRPPSSVSSPRLGIHHAVDHKPAAIPAHSMLHRAENATARGLAYWKENVARRSLKTRSTSFNHNEAAGSIRTRAVPATGLLTRASCSVLPAGPVSRPDVSIRASLSAITARHDACTATDESDALSMASEVSRSASRLPSLAERPCIPASSDSSCSNTHPDAALTAHYMAAGLLMGSGFSKRAATIAGYLPPRSHCSSRYKRDDAQHAGTASGEAEQMLRPASGIAAMVARLPVADPVQTSQEWVNNLPSPHVLSPATTPYPLLSPNGASVTPSNAPEEGGVRQAAKQFVDSPTWFAPTPFMNTSSRSSLTEGGAHNGNSAGTSARSMSDSSHSQSKLACLEAQVKQLSQELSRMTLQSAARATAAEVVSHASAVQGLQERVSQLQQLVDSLTAQLQSLQASTSVGTGTWCDTSSAVHQSGADSLVTSMPTFHCEPPAESQLLSKDLCVVDDKTASETGASRSSASQQLISTGGGCSCMDDSDSADVVMHPHKKQIIMGEPSNQVHIEIQPEVLDEHEHEHSSLGCDIAPRVSDEQLLGSLAVNNAAHDSGSTQCDKPNECSDVGVSTPLTHVGATASEDQARRATVMRVAHVSHVLVYDDWFTQPHAALKPSTCTAAIQEDQSGTQRTQAPSVRCTAGRQTSMASYDALASLWSGLWSFGRKRSGV